MAAPFEYDQFSYFMQDKQKKFRKRVAEVTREELANPEVWHYVSFANDVFLGAVIIMGHGITDVVSKCHRLNISPGGEVLAIPMPDEIIAQVPETHRNRLLSMKEIKSIWSDAKTIREHEEDEKLAREREKGPQ